MADGNPPTRARRLKIAARVPEDEIPCGKPADWLSQDNGEYTIFVVSFYQLDVYICKVTLWAR